jgi:hypothetical protein
MSLSKNSKFIINELELENSGLSQTNDVLPDREKEVLVYINVYEDPASKLDKMQEMYDLLRQINDKKQEIVDKCNQAFNNTGCELEPNEGLLYGNGEILSIEVFNFPLDGVLEENDGNKLYKNVLCTGGSGSGATFDVLVENKNVTNVSIVGSGVSYTTGDILTISGSNIGISTLVPSNVSGRDLEIEVTKTDEDKLVFSETGKTFRIVPGIPPAITYEPVAFGVIRRDRIRVVYYPRLEDQSSLPQNNNAVEGLIFPRITSGSTNSQFRGKGRATILSANSSFNDGAIDYRIRDDAGTWGVDGLKRGSGWSGGDNIMGRYYKLKDNCGTRRSDINTLSNQIANLRSQINDLLEPINPLKDKKHGYQLQYWSYRRSRRVNNDTISSNNTLKNYINDPNNSNIFG